MVWGLNNFKIFILFLYIHMGSGYDSVEYKHSILFRKSASPSLWQLQWKILISVIFTILSRSQTPILVIMMFLTLHVEHISHESIIGTTFISPTHWINISSTHLVNICWISEQVLHDWYRVDELLEVLAL